MALPFERPYGDGLRERRPASAAAVPEGTVLPLLRRRRRGRACALTGVLIADPTALGLGPTVAARCGYWPAGVALAGVGIALAADAPSYWLCRATRPRLGSQGAPRFIPKDRSSRASVSGRKRASGMSWFSIGGNVGYGLGPVVTTAIVVALGLRGGPLLALPSLVVGRCDPRGAPRISEASCRSRAPRMQTRVKTIRAR